MFIDRTIEDQARRSNGSTLNDDRELLGYTREQHNLSDRISKLHYRLKGVRARNKQHCVRVVEDAIAVLVIRINEVNHKIEVLQ